MKKDAKAATELLQLIGYDDKEIARAIAKKFPPTTRAKACGTVQHTKDNNQHEGDSHAH